MSHEECIQHLVEELLESRHSPEEVCAEYPELLPDVRRRLAQVRSLESEVDALFPESTSRSGGMGKKVRPDGSLPLVPGHEVQAMVGYGGMGVVYKARHLRLNRPVAIKMLLSGAHMNRVRFSSLMREAQVIARLRHPNIVQVYDVGDLDGLTYFTMEFMDGGSLAQLMHGAPQPPGEAVKILITLARAVEAAHQGGIIHRDLKPSNVLLTNDGTLKVSDFGLSQRVEAEEMVTARAGTPSYMAPEQAEGTAEAVGRGVDIYALGAILYELLTGRPPFKGETSAETLRQVISMDPVSPRLLNPKIPCDLETICLKCLRKEADRRYGSAAELGEDLERFMRGEPVVARPVGAVERTLKWIRRRPSQAAVIAATGALCAAVIFGAVYVTLQAAHTSNAVSADLIEVERLQGQADWEAAKASLTRAEARLGAGGPAELHARFAAASDNLKLVMNLDNLRLNRMTSGESAFYREQAELSYAAAFRGAGIGTPADDPLTIAARIRNSPVRIALTAAIDDWANCATGTADEKWVLSVAGNVGMGRNNSRRSVFDPKVWKDAGAISNVAQTIPLEGESVSLLVALGERLQLLNQETDSIGFLRRVQQQYPGDFWPNLILGNALLYHSAEAGGFYRAALALRPNAAVCYCAVGDALRVQGSYAEATVYYDRAIDKDKTYARSYTNKGLMLENQGLLNEAINLYQEAIDNDKNYAWAHYNLAHLLLAKGREADAKAEYMQALELDPKNAKAGEGLRTISLREGMKLAELQRSWRMGLADGPTDPNAWFGYAELSLFLGDRAEYEWARRQLLDRFGSSTSPDVTEPVSRAVLLLPLEGEDLEKAVSLADIAVASRETTPPWIYRYYEFAQGLVDYRTGRFGDALDVMMHDASTVMGPAPRLVAAMAYQRLGSEADARKMLATAEMERDWSESAATERDIWIQHILRREAEQLIAPKMAAFLAGEYEPRDELDREIFIGECQFRGMHGAAAVLYSKIFAARPELMADLSNNARLFAARSAAMAGCGRSVDSAKLDVESRARWRRQARQWLSSDVQARLVEALKGKVPVRTLVRQTLNGLKGSADFAGIRDASEIADLGSDERAECVALWSQVDGAIRKIDAIK